MQKSAAGQQPSLSKDEASIPFLLSFIEQVDLRNPSFMAAGGTSYSTSSGGRETEFDEDP